MDSANAPLDAYFQQLLDIGGEVHAAMQPRAYDFDPGKIVAIDTETTGLHAWIDSQPFAVSMANAAGDVWYCEWAVNPFTREVIPNPKSGPVSLAVDSHTNWSLQDLERMECEFETDVEFIRAIMEDETITKVFHNGKFDIRMMEVHLGVKFRGRLQETVFAARACNSMEDNYTLKHLGEKYCGVNREDADRLQQETARLRRIAKNLGYKIHKDIYADYWLPKHFNHASTLCQEYAVLDAVRTMMLWLMYDEALDTVGVRELYEAEMALWQCTYDMESRGVRVNVDLCKSERIRNENTTRDALAKMRQLSNNPDLNPNSAAQLIKVCKQRGIAPTEVTAKGDPSMSFNSIRTIADDEFIHNLQRYRASLKVCTTFLDKYIWHAVPDPISVGGHCLHPMFNQAAAQTGRYGCSHPNLQQVVNANGARNAVEAMSARMAFGPRSGYTWYHFDYSQLELYLFAGVAQEEFMLHHMMSGHDLHSECANKAWGGRGNEAALIKGAVALECEAEKPTTDNVQRIWDAYGWQPKYALDRKAKNEFTAWWLDTYGGDNWDIVKAEKALGKKVARTRAKFVMYAKIFGGGPLAIKNFLYCSMDEARAFQAEYDAAFPRIKAFLKTLSRQAERDGYVTNAFGRKVGIPEGFYYKSVNFLVQSTAADLLKTAMRKCYAYVKQIPDWHLLLTIHDELVFEVPHDPFDGLELISTLNKDGTTKSEYKFTVPNTDAYVHLKRIKDMMEDNEGRFTVPVPVELARCDDRWDVKVGVEF